ncbi:unnamed protein product [Angiostrongylus costaricensis]|uniref:Retinol dehydrogenase 14 n=1 Tax=Angiostrongylus costaricensis TaxID=334426 RepID=A0A0R3PTL7_ANGCS|nr:unnamed protein product [Angiostrongylus costaricensis]
MFGCSVLCFVWSRVESAYESAVQYARTALDWTDVMATKDYEKYLVYSRSKLCLHLMAFALHRRMNIARRKLAVNVVELGKEREPNNNGRMRTASALSNSTSTLSMFRTAGNLVQLIENPMFENIEDLLKSMKRPLQEVNHLSHYVISRQLRPLLARNAPSRIIFVSSLCYDWYPLDFSDLQAVNYGEPYRQYSRSKLMNHLTALRMARDKGDGVTVNVLEPGVIETKLLRRGGYSGGPVKNGSCAPVHLVMSDELQSITGVYFNNRGKKITSLSSDSTDCTQQDRLWKMSEEICARFGVTF